MRGREFITEETRAKLARYADWLQQSKIARDFCMARNVLTALGLKEDAIEPAKKSLFGYNGTFEIARLALGLDEHQAVCLFFFQYSDGDLAVFTFRSNDELAWIDEWRKTRSLKKRRELAVGAIIHYMEKWRAQQGDAIREAARVVEEFETENPRPWIVDRRDLITDRRGVYVQGGAMLNNYIDALKILAEVKK